MTVGSVNFAADDQNRRPQINVVVNADTTQLDESIAKTKELLERADKAIAESKELLEDIDEISVKMKELTARLKEMDHILKSTARPIGR